MFQAKARQARGRINYRIPLTEHSLNIGRLFWWITLPGRYGGPVTWDLGTGTQIALANNASGFGWTPTSNPGGKGSLKFGTSTYATTTFKGSNRNAVSVACWIIPGTTGRGDLVTCWHNGTTLGDQFDLLYGLTAGKPQFYISSGSALGTSGVNPTGGAMTVGLPYRVMGTFDGTTVAVYLNGALQASATPGLSLGSGTNLYIGNNQAGDGQFTGNINDVSMWNRGLPAEEAWEDYILSQEGYPGVINRDSTQFFPGPPAANPFWTQGLPLIGCGA